jgi:hypothetical protein
VNYGVNGQTTVSFKKKGYWRKVVEEVKKVRGAWEVYVTIQFEHA